MPKVVKEPTEAEIAYGLARDALDIFVTLVMRTDDGRAALPPKHLLELVIPAIEDDTLGHTLIVAPPGSVKTNTMIAACAWWLGRNPDQHIAYVCDNATRAEERSLAVRALIEESPEYRTVFPSVEPNQKRGWAQGAWYLQRKNLADKNASFLAAGMDSSIIGARLDRIILDDIWNNKIADSELEKQRAYRKLQNEIMTRLHPSRGRVIGICTRWAEDDFAAWAMEKGWHTITIKAIDDDGRSYWESYYPRHWLRCKDDEHTGQQCCKYREIGSAAFGQQYMGEVLPTESAIFKPNWWGEYEGDVPEWDRGVIVIDTAGWDAGSKTSDFAALSVWLKAGQDYYVAEVVEDRLDFIAVKQIAKNMRETWGVPILVEDVPWARPLIQALQKETSGVVPWKVQGRSKQNRAEAVASIVEAGRVYLPKKAPWKERWIHQHATFPHAKNDDLVDQTSMALGYLDRNVARSRAPRVYRPMRRWEHLYA